MLPSGSSPANASGSTSNDARPLFAHSHSPHQGGFTVPGVTNYNPSGSPSLRHSALGSGMNVPFGSSLNDSLGQSRSHYQTGYLMSVQPNNASPQGGSRSEEAPIVQTKAKLNHVFAGSAASDFGMDSMFESSRRRQRQPLADEDAPPTNSVNDIINEVSSDTARYPSLRNSTLESSTNRASLYRSSNPSTPKPSTPAAPAAPEPLYVDVFGYPPDKYSVTAEYFRSFGQTTVPYRDANISNCFRIGYTNPGDAMRAVRKNGEVLSGSWMVGVKWTDPAQAEAVLGPNIVRGVLQTPEMATTAPETAPAVSTSTAQEAAPPAGAQGPATPATPTPTFGNPVRLAPAASAFRKPGTGPSTTATPQRVFPTGGLFGASTGPGSAQASPSKGVLEQVSDLIFGW
ncbi:uncharacterized protein LAESUDRAFT_722173 [Laetiporus sulphureus 93-53]|uniref:RRM Nup35-type domain-containing protein n=1 Tax=Laetiporus sulphureus 93-53 TaxID=1314785 RepID=A0A165G9J3_9APHY|nr:uncharacterized protein LAESUDRAFT_722173 [Laetiporus sulphureus 93-53]KZT10027.1 hypothetical protein LAESUDRAFT_722173 [Laetiporus sulphureus 93-53]